MKHINWVNTIFLTVTPVIGVVGTAVLAYLGMINTSTLWLTLVGCIVGNLAITAGYHRLFSHGTYQATWPVRLVFLLIGAACFQGSVLEWSTDHRDHHRYTDTDRDPYDISKGFWFAHMLWLFQLDYTRRNYDNVKELAADPMIAFQHRFYKSIAIVVGFIIPTLIASMWGDALGGFIVACCLRLTFTHHTTFAINSFTHYFGKKPYSDTQSARDSLWNAILTHGEGYHNFHHQFPLDYRNGIRFYDYDPTKWFIQLLASCKLASNLKTVSMARILKYRLRMDEQRLQQRLSVFSEQMAAPLLKMTQPVREKLLETFDRLVMLEKEYRQLKRAAVTERLADAKSQMKAARKELKRFWVIWCGLVNEKTLRAWQRNRSFQLGA